MAEPTSVALIAACGAVVGCLINGFFLVKNQKKNLEFQRDNAEISSRAKKYTDKELERLKSELVDRKSEKDARRDYEYDALRRLYMECSPILFQLSEHAAIAVDRVRSIARSAAGGKLDDLQESWLTTSQYRYYLSSSEYRLLAPLACFQILKERITHLDMSLDPEIQAIYILGRQAQRLLSEDFKMAADFSYKLNYEPNLSEKDPNSVEMPEVKRQQGIPRGIVENAVEAMLERGTNGSLRVISFAQYDTIFNNKNSVEAKPFERLRYFLGDFHPQKRPVTWRILIAQALVFRAIVKISASKTELQLLPVAEILFSISSKEEAGFNWEKSLDDFSPIIKQSICVAHEYLRANLFDELDRALGMANEKNVARQKSR